MMRRYPLYIFLDVTSKFDTELIKHFFLKLFAYFRSEPYLLENLYVSTISHNNRCVLSKTKLTPILDVNIENDLQLCIDIVNEDSYDKEFDFYFESKDKNDFIKLCQCTIYSEVIKTSTNHKGDRKPVILYINNDKIDIECRSISQGSSNYFCIGNEPKILGKYINHLFYPQTDNISIKEFQSLI